MGRTSPEQPNHLESQSEVAPAIDELGPSQIIEVLHTYARALRERRKGIDKLNVYPVPDGDTGTNMSLTMQSVLTELKAAAHDDMHAIATAVSKGATLGARGNSGAILAQVLRGIAETVKEKSSVGPNDLAEALERARSASYQAVLKPVEGTILTVVSAASAAAQKSATEGHKLRDQLHHVHQAAADALARTPELLPVLKQAGVVDAGGSGFMLLVDALRYVATGEPLPGAKDDLDEVHEPDIHDLHSEISELRYEVMFLLDAADERIPEFRAAWAAMGDSIVVVGGDGMWNCHIHADDIGPTIEAAIAIGRPHQIRITDLQEQAQHVHGEDWTHDGAEYQESHFENVSVVAVISGNGMRAAFRSLGVSQIVSGGQSMNPSVGELLDAVNGCKSHDVLVLPNNKNIIPSARQLDELSSKSVRVLPTINPAVGLAALVHLDPEDSGEANFERLCSIVGSIRSGEITQAVRDAQTSIGAIKKGQWMAICNDEIVAVAPSMDEALLHLIGTMVDVNTEVVTLFEGAGATQQATEVFVNAVQEQFGGVVVETIAGEQSLYPYLLSAE